MKTYEWGALTVLQGDCAQSLRSLPVRQFQTCVTSPPYFGLRDYGVDGQIGLEQTPDEYVAKMVEVFREVRRVLRDDGTLWLNLGDSYAGGGGGNYNKTGRTQADGQHVTNVRNRPGWLEAAGVKAKDLIGIPWRVALALQADGWYLRQDIVWAKPNPMPESVTDRCTKAHEYLFLLTKRERYFWDAEAMKEPAVCAGTRPSAPKGSFTAKGEPLPGRLPFRAVTETRNRRSVWTVATRPYKGAHFATYPPDLIEPCILAGSRPGDAVLDPFGGSGTTARVALGAGRRAALCEINPEYVALIKQRAIVDLYGSDLFP